MDTQNTVRTVSSKRVGNTAVQSEQVVTGTNADPHEFSLAKSSQVLWYLGHLIAIILALRFVFLALGANMTGIVLFIYNISSVFVLPFRGIFPSPRQGEFYFDTAALLAILIFYLLIWMVTSALRLFSNRAPEEI